MHDITVANAKDQFSDLLRRAEHGGERFIIRRHGKPVAALLPMQDLRRIEALEDEEDLRDARTALAEARVRGTVPLETVLKRHGLSHLLVRERPLEKTARPRKPRGRPTR